MVPPRSAPLKKVGPLVELGLGPDVERDVVDAVAVLVRHGGERPADLGEGKVAQDGGERVLEGQGHEVRLLLAALGGLVDLPVAVVVEAVAALLLDVGPDLEVAVVAVAAGDHRARDGLAGLDWVVLVPVAVAVDVHVVRRLLAAAVLGHRAVDRLGLVREIDRAACARKEQEHRPNLLQRGSVGR